MSYAQKAVRGIGIIFAMNIVAYLVAYLTRLLLARKLGPSDYGLFYAVFTFIIFFLFFRDIGLNVALTKYISEFRALQKFNEIKTAIVSALLIQISSSAIAGGIFFASAGFLAKHYFKNPAAEVILKIMILYTLLSISFTFLKGFFAGFQKFKIFAFIDTAKNTIILILIIIFFSRGFQIFSPVLAYSFAGLFLLIVFLVPLFKTYNPFRYKLTKFSATTKMLLVFGLPVIIADVGDKIISYIDTLMLTSFRSLHEVGIYNVVLPSAMALLFPGMAIANVVFPVFAELWARKDTKRLNEGLRLLHKYVFIMVAPIVFTIFVSASFFLSVFFGKEYAEGALAMQILLVGILLFIVAGINNSIISSTGHPKAVTRIIFAAAATNAGVNLLLIPRFGIEGAAIATTLSYALALALSTIKVSRTLGTKMPLSAWFRTAVASALFVLAAWLAKNLLAMNVHAETAIALIAATSIYILTLFILKLVNLKEIRFYISLILKRKTEPEVAAREPEP